MKSPEGHVFSPTLDGLTFARDHFLVIVVSRAGPEIQCAFLVTHRQFTLLFSSAITFPKKKKKKKKQKEESNKTLEKAALTFGLPLIWV